MKKRVERTNGATKSIVFLAFPGSQILDITGPYQVFVRAAEIFLRTHAEEHSPYKVVLASTTRSKNIPTNCGLTGKCGSLLCLLPMNIHGR